MKNFKREVKWWTRWWFRYFPGHMYRRLFVCRGKHDNLIEGEFCSICYSPWFLYERYKS